LLHSDLGGPSEAAKAVVEKFRGELPVVKTSLDELAANFTDPASQGPVAYPAQYLTEHPELGNATVKADSIIAVQTFLEILNGYYD